MINKREIRCVQHDLYQLECEENFGAVISGTCIAHCTTAMPFTKMLCLWEINAVQYVSKTLIGKYFIKIKLNRFIIVKGYRKDQQIM